MRRLLWETRRQLLWETRLPAEAVDYCQCFCSIDGCSVLSVLLGNLQYRALNDHDSEQWRTYSFWIGCIELQPELKYNKALELVRFATFDLLELKHTCCHQFWHEFLRYPNENGEYRDWYDEEELRRINDEQLHSIERLDMLMVEFSQLYAGKNAPLGEFLRCHWRLRMLQVGEEIFSWDDSDLIRIRQLGVRVTAGIEETRKERARWLLRLNNWAGMNTIGAELLI